MSTVPITFGQINDKNINLLRKFNLKTFPVRYSTSLYSVIMNDYKQLSRFAYYNDIIIGAYSVRLEQYQGELHAYIVTIGVLQPYRKLGIGQQLMQHLQKEVTQTTKAVGIYLHMHVLNTVGKKFYEKCGFTVDKQLDNYYTDLEEPHCYLIRKMITKRDQKEGQNGKNEVIQQK